MTDLDLLEEAWGIIANVSGGNWNAQSLDWRIAAEKFREKYHARLKQQLVAVDEQEAEMVLGTISFMDNEGIATKDHLKLAAKIMEVFPKYKVVYKHLIVE